VFGGESTTGVAGAVAPNSNFNQVSSWATAALSILPLLLNSLITNGTILSILAALLAIGVLIVAGLQQNIKK